MDMDSAMSIDPKACEEYTIGWICALPKEQIAAVLMLDKRHPDPVLYISPNDTNSYFVGSIGPHNVVITCLPSKCYGTNRTAETAAQMLNSFPSIKTTFMVGIGAGIPTKVALGDVVVGTEWAQWDFGKANGDNVFEYTGRKCFPPELLSVMSKIRTEHSLRGCTQIAKYIRNLGAEHPHLASEYCLRPDAAEKSQSTLGGNPEDIRIHYGLIASGNQVVKDAKVRDDINKRLEGQVLCLEMEAAGLVGIPAVVIRGICDYADSNKNDDWQEYAAAVAAACAKEFIISIEPAAAREIQINREEFDRVANEITILRGSLAGDEERKILEWITPIDDSAQHNDFFNRRQPGTGNWFLNSSKYQNWLHTPKSILYCPGIPGAGKTILTSVVVDDLLERYSYDPAVGIAYVYFNFKGSAYLHIDDLLSSLLKQLVRTQDLLPTYIKELYDHFKGIGRPSRVEIMNSIHTISAAYSRIFIVIDALDEYEEYSEFLEKVFEIYKLQRLSIFATSRPIPDIRDKFKGKESCTEYEIRASNEDVCQYLEGQILRLGTKAVKYNKEIIKNRIAELVQGMFLLAHLYLEAIKTAKTLKMINRILGSFSSDRGASNSAYDNAYSAIMERIRGNDEELVPITFKVLMWITCASRRLTKAELQHAIAVEPEKPTGIDNDNIFDIEDLISLCLGLVTIDEESNVVRLIHYTAQEYFERTKQYWFSNPHDYLAKTCVIYLSYDDFKSGPCSVTGGFNKRIKLNSLYSYAVKNFAYHVQESSPESTETLSLILLFLLEDNLRLAWVQAWFYLNEPGRFQQRDDIEGMRALHVAAYCGLTQAVGALLPEKRADLAAQERFDDETPLSLAARRGHKDVVELLIKEGAGLEVKNGNGTTPLWSAVSSGRETITRLLIEAKADISAKDSSGQTLISFAASRRDEGVVRLLIERLMDAELEEMYYEIACAAARYGYEDIMKRLIERDVNLDSTAGRHQIKGSLGELSPLWHAIKARHEGVVRLIVDSGANLEQEYNHEKPIFFASRHGYEGVVRALGRRANLEVEEESSTPLSVAVKNRQRGGENMRMEMASTQRSNPPQSPLRDALALDHPCDLENLSTTNREFEGGRSVVEIGARIATDSGYASITHGTELCARNDHGIKFQSLNTSEHMSTAMDHLDLDDTQTVYSDASSVPTLVKESYISELADALLNEVLPHKPDADTLERISLVLPDVLKAFALKIGQNAPTQMHRDVMFFIHKSRGDIAKYFNRKLLNEPEQEENDFRTHVPASDGMLYTEVVERWRLGTPQGTIMEDPQNPLLMESQDPALKEPEDPFLEEPQNLSHFWETSLAEDAQEVKGGDGQEINVPQLPAYRDFIFKVAAYEWLLGRLSRELFLTPAKPNIMDEIRRTIAQKLPSNHRISKSQSAETFKIIFVVRWNPTGFIAEQDYEEEPGEAIEKAITLTGSIKDAQALTCKEYFCQTWRSGGKHTIQLIKDTVQNGPHNLQASTLPDGTQLIACIQDSKLIVEAVGTRDSVAEVGEQLGWLGAAFYSSAWDAGLTSVIPIINEINPRDISKSTPGPPRCPELICDIDFIIQERTAHHMSSTDPISSNGQCWHKMFRNPVVVEGYPIVRRPKVESGIGLEIPLNMMAALAQTKRVNIFDGKIFIKGYSAMLIPIKRDGDMLIWHFLYNDTGERISYLDKTFHAEDISIPALETARHVVGWCSKASYHAGATDAVYNIKSSRLPKTHGGCALREVCAIRGQIVSGGSQFAIGNKDIPLRLSRKGKWHIPGLKWIHKKFVVMWDEQDKRGWLVNGTSALLHLLYGSLAHDSTDEFSSKFLFKKERMHEPIKPHKACSAIEVLLNENNLKQEIYPGESVHYCVEDRLEELYNMLEKIIDYQMTVSSTPSTPRYLEGWDFKDLATGGDPIYPRVATLEAIGQSWVDFTRAIHAIALFGRGFGEIIQPADTGMCTYWKELPKQKYYLAAGLRDLRSIMGLGIDEEIEMPPKLVDDVVWHIPQSTFGQCQCKEKKSEDHSDFVQALLPSKFSRFLPENEPIRWDDDSAVIFGHNTSFEWLWKDSRDLQGDEPVMLSKEPKTPSLDSGIGSNLLFGPKCYTVGVICALKTELFAVRALFNPKHKNLHLPPQDINHYALGHIQGHDIVAACLPSGEYGTNAAAHVLSHMIRSFTKVEFCCLVGIGAGIPTKENDLRLGDVVVSHPTGTHAGVIQYDLGKALGGDLFERTGCIQRLPTFILTAISSLRSDPDLPPQPLQKHIDDIIARCPEYKFPGIQHDKILVAECLDDPNHVACRRCSDQSRNNPKIHYGLIASGNQVIKDAKTRDRLYRDYKVHCIEMEAAGVMNVFPCVVIRGICDYADSDKNDLWQEYASATAAAYLKLLLSVIRNRDDSEGTRSGKRAASPLNYDSSSTKKLKDTSYLVSPTKSQPGTTPDRGSTWTSQDLL